MKTLLNPSRTLFLLAASLGLSFAQPARATDDKPVTVRVDKTAAHTYLVRVSNPSQKWSQVRLERADNGAELYHSSDFAPAYGRLLNLKHLEDGKYNLVVKSGKTVSRFTLNMHTQAQERVCQISEKALATR